MTLTDLKDCPRPSLTLEDVRRLCPAPPDMRWEDALHGHFLCVSNNPDGRQIHLDPTWVKGFGLYKFVATGAWLAGFHGAWFHGEADIGDAYLQALTAVGLAEDPEKEALRAEVSDLRRRLTWSEDVPTGDGLVLVWHPGDDEPEMWRTLGTADGIQWEHHNYVGHGNPFPPGTRFLPLVNLKEP